MSTDQDKLLNQILSTLQHIESDLCEDRTTFEKLENKLDGILSLQKTLQDRIPRVEDKVSDAVSNAVTDAIEPLREGVEEAIKHSPLKVHKSFLKNIVSKFRR